MNVIRESRFRGVLPAGLILNSVLPSQAQLHEDVVFKPKVAGYSGPTPTELTSVSLKGEFLDPVVLADLREQGLFTTPKELNMYPEHPMKLDPFHDAVMLMTNVEFSGTIVEYSDTPIVAQLPMIGAEAVASYQEFHPVVQGQVQTGELLCTPALSCDVYIPARLRYQSAFAANQTTLESVFGGVIGGRATLASSVGLPHQEGFDIALSGFEFKLPAIAHANMALGVGKDTPTQPELAHYLVPATLLPVSQEGRALDLGAAAFYVSSRISATILATDKGSGLAVEQGAFQQITRLYSVEDMSVFGPTFISFSQVGAY